MAAPYLKKDIKMSMLSQPVLHDHLFGQEFDKCTEQVIKEQSATQKILHKAQSYVPQLSSSTGHPRKAQPSFSKYPAKTSRPAFDNNNPNYDPVNSRALPFRSVRGRGRGRFKGHYSASRNRY